MADINKILSSLGLDQDNAGVWTATGGWRKSSGGKVIESINPATAGHSPGCIAPPKRTTSR